MNWLMNAGIGYLLGSIPSGVLVGRVATGRDVREYGSGKTGFTNTLRSAGIGAALIVITVDIAKGALPVIIGRFVFDDPWAVAVGAVAAVAGHNWPLFAGFRGGRGVATSFGAFVAMAPPAALGVLVLGMALLAATRYVSLTSMAATAAGFVAILALVIAGQLPAPYLLFAVAAGTAVEFSHLDNARRLLAGTEPKLGHGGVRRNGLQS
jgi:glycerol-3-phosphate acyltransferase PlsY